MSARDPYASFALASSTTIAGRFELGRHLGTGGMGTVYEAFDRENDVRVALKTLARFEPAFLLHLKNEFRSLQGVRHRNLVALRELMEYGGQWFVAMELVEGVALLEYVRPGGFGALPSGASETRRIAGPPALEMQGGASRGEDDDADPSPRTQSIALGAELRVDRLRDALVQLAQGLCALHDAGKVHRDVKPANVLIEPTGRLVVVDFGLTIDAGTKTSFRPAGTRAYMAPEQAAGQIVGPSADWYCVGVLLYLSLTGRLPFRGGDAARRKVSGTLEPVRSHNPTAPDDLVDLCHALLEVDPTRRPSGRQVLERLGAGSVPEPPRRVPFVGRQREHAALERALHDSRQRPVVVVVRGESGFGKTALVQEQLFGSSSKDAGALVFWGRCYERELVPYKAFDGIVDALGDFLARAGRTASVPEGAAALARIFPVLRRLEGFDAPDAAPAEDAQDAQALAFAALRQLVGSIARERPVVLAIDDMQWADADSHRLIDDLLGPPLPPAVCVVMTARCGAGETTDVFEDLSLRFEDVRPIDLGPLPFDEARRLARAALGPTTDADVLESIVREAAGHPLYLVTLARHLPAVGGGRAGEVKLDDALWEQAKRSDPGARRVLQLAAVAGAPLGAATLVAASGLDRAQYDASVRWLEAERLVRATPASGAELLEPYHDRVRESVTARLEPAELRDLHRRLADALRVTSRSANDAASLVRHLAGAGDTAGAADHAETAARQAEGAFAFDLAAEMIRTSIRLGSHDSAARQALRERLAEMLANAGRAAEAALSYVEAAADASSARKLELRRHAADHWLRSGHIERGLEILAEVLREIGDDLPSKGTAIVSTVAGRVRARVRGLRWAARSEAEVEPSVLRRIDVYHAVGVSLSLIDPLRGGCFEMRALRLALDVGEPRRLAAVLAMQAGYLASGGAPGIARAQRLLAQVARIDATTGDGYQGCLLPMMEGFVDYHAGRFRRAATGLREVERRLRAQAGTYFERAFCHCFRLITLRYCGRYGELERGQFEWLRMAERRGDLFSEAAIRFNLNCVWLARDAPHEARRDLARTRWVPPRGGYHMQHWYEQQARFEIDLYTGDARRSLRAFRKLRAGLSLVSRVRLHRVHILWLLGRLLLAAADEGDGVERLAEVADVARRLAREDVPFARTYALLLTAGLERRRGDEAACIRALESATELADASDYPHCAAAGRLRLGAMVGGARGSALVQQGRDWMAGQSIVDPDRMARIWAPGFEAVR